MPSCSLAFSWPMNSPSHLGRSFSSNELSSSARSAETSRSESLLPADIGIRLAVSGSVSESPLILFDVERVEGGRRHGSSKEAHYGLGVSTCYDSSRRSAA